MATALAAVLALAGVVLWNLRAGFSDYLYAQDAEQLARLADIAERDLAERDALPQDWRLALRRWLVEAREGREGRIASDAPRRPDAEAPQRPRRHLGALRRDPAGIGPRLVLLGADGTTPLAGRRDTLDRPGQSAALEVNGRTVAVLRLAERAGQTQ
ncbi:MAG: hypothetical protein EOP35_26265, partial [Rubrivivax sp.]